MSSIVNQTDAVEAVAVVDGSMVKLVSNDGEHFEVLASIAKLSKMVATGIEGNADESETPEIALPFVKAVTLTKIVEFLKHHAETPLGDIPKPLRTKEMKDAVPVWYCDYIKLEQEPLFELTLAANYMEIPPLLELCSAAIAIQIKGKKTCKEIAEHFGIQREYTEPTEADVERLRAKYPWMDKQPAI